MSNHLTAGDWSTDVYDAAVALTEVYEHTAGDEKPTDECLVGIYEYMASQAALMLKWAKREASQDEVDRLKRLHSRYSRQLLVVQTRLHSVADESVDEEEGYYMP